MKATKKQKKLVEIGGDFIDRITRRRTFEPLSQPAVGCRYHIFKRKGEFVEGILGLPVVNYRRGTSYPLELQSGEIEEIVGNKLLHQLIRKGDLCGRMVRITYIGSEYTHAGHFRKIYRVFKIF